MVRSFVFAIALLFTVEIANKRALAACGKLVLPFEPLGINVRELEYRRRRRRRRTQSSQTTEQNSWLPAK